ncbi:GNAT family N-acetyltransferase [Rhodovulum sp. DZ06]|uniref:GNAT family N-acetyltransferase n=1 Tax=Rhodovulum sp. DZ06 TaxID=3425126 RepID=UPI003D34F659
MTETARKTSPAPRPARPEDADAVTELLTRSYTRLFDDWYDAPTLTAALPVMAKANPKLLESEGWFVVEEDGVLIGCGGWSAEEPETGAVVPGEGHGRHFATHPDHLRRGVGRAIWDASVAQAKAQGVTRMIVYSSLPAESFYTALGFRPLRQRFVNLPGGARFVSVEMEAKI